MTVRQTLLLCIALCAAGCRSFDPDVFDRRLRHATVEHLADEVQRTHGGAQDGTLRDPPWSDAALQSALDAPDRLAFHRALSHLLLALNDPHVRLRPPRSLRRDLAWQPVHFDWVRTDGRLHVGFSSGHLEDSTRAATWHDTSVPLSDRLRASVAEGPKVWCPVVEADGWRITEPFQLEQLLAGPVLSALTLVVEVDGTHRTVALPRNGRRIQAGQLRFLETPAALAERIDGSSALSPAWTPVDAAAPSPRRFPRADCVVEPPPEWSFRSADVEAWRTADTAYLRIGSFSGAEDESDTVGTDFHQRVDRAFEAFEGTTSLVLDLEGNPGGRWDRAAHLLAYLLPDRRVMPYEVHERRPWLAGLWTIRTIHRFLRPDVDPHPFRRVAVLVDQRTGSAAEVVASSLAPLDHVQIIGERTVGAEYAVHEFETPDGSTVQFGKAGGMRAPSPHFQGEGLAPDLIQDVQLDDLRAAGRKQALQRRSRRALEDAFSWVGSAASDWF